jgi:hypothetical protein
MSSVSNFGGVDVGDLDCDPAASLIVDFSRLAIQNSWKKNSPEYKQYRAAFIRDEFEAQFGNNLSALGGWQALCKAVGVNDNPTSITQCKKVSSECTLSGLRLESR